MRNRSGLLLALAAMAVVVAVLALGFLRLGSPAHQREITADARRVSDLRAIAFQIHASAPPPALRFKDPVTGAPYEYRAKAGTEYELCATFAAEGDETSEQWAATSDFWRHPKGRYCYQLDSSKTPQW